MKTTKEKLSDFGKHFLDDQGLTVPISTLSGILEVKNTWTLTLAVLQTAQFPLLEMHLVEWAGRANYVAS